MTGHGSKLGRKKEAAISALLSKPTVKAAAAAVPLDEKTLRRWLQEPAFADAYRVARLQVFQAAIGLLQRLAGRAAAALGKNLKAPREQDQIRAAALILQLGRDGIELEDLARRVEALEKQLKASGRKP
jgi:hypothetical protein